MRRLLQLSKLFHLRRLLWQSRLCPMRRLLQQRSRLRSRVLRRPQQSHRLHMTLPPLPDHLSTFYPIPLRRYYFLPLFSIALQTLRAMFSMVEGS
ncbi:hypothetical protein CK203_029205 [Vitis vinifera]|uniref:Uncharacterized protein n=1 Tax=Vitis vinifera TaxID=29760 RepID=A0A438IST8_VITVI|nr:hypothetical protein CK203_029205 [Vitis vinifera]